MLLASHLTRHLYMYINLSKNHLNTYHNHLIMILNNEIYTGVLQQGKTRKINYKLNKRINLNKEEWVCCEETVPAIISKEQFMYANISLSNRKKM